MTALPLSSPRPQAPPSIGRSGRPGAAALLVLAVSLNLGLSLGPGQARAEPGSNAYEAELCAAPDDSLSPTRWLRATSLAVRGLVPTLEEYQAVADADAETLEATVDQLVDEWLVSDAFAERFVRLHRDLFWNNILDQRLHAVNVGLSPGNNTTSHWTRLGTMATRYRGRSVRCLNEPARFGEDGEILTTPQADGTNLEGWVWVAPYWDPQNPIKVCAFDAQDRLFSANGVACNSNQGLVERDCGCGPNLNWCAAAPQMDLVQQSFMDDLERRVREVIFDDRPYLDLFTSTKGWVNGPIVHFLKHQSTLTRTRVQPVLTDVSRLPDLPFTAVDTWVEVDLGEHHAGLLTSPSYLLRFQTDRARANRFYTAFLCQPFNPPAGGLPVADEASIREPDLQLRDGCSYCHALLEPAAAHWGRYSERGMAWLDPRVYPRYDDACSSCVRSGLPCPTRCTQNYVTNPMTDSEARWLGWLNGYVFRRDEHMRSIEEGPRLLAHRSAVDGRLPRCTAITAAERLFGEELSEQDEPLVDMLAQHFVASGFAYRELVKELVMHKTFRRVR